MNRPSQTCEMVTKGLIFTSPESQKKKKHGAEKIFLKTLAENFTSLRKDINLQIQETQRREMQRNPWPDK